MKFNYTIGHIEKEGLNGNRLLPLFSVYHLEDNEEVVHFFETFDFDSKYIIDLLYQYNIDFTYECDDISETIETDTLMFCFSNMDFVAVYKKVNIFDSLQEKYDIK